MKQTNDNKNVRMKKMSELKHLNGKKNISTTIINCF